MDRVALAKHGDLFTIPCEGGGFSCLGFDVCVKRSKAAAAWLRSQGVPTPEVDYDALRGTLESYRAYREVYDQAREYYDRTGTRCPVELTPQLMGLEGMRVEVEDFEGYKRRFNVGRSTGWIPVHLELHNRAVSGGPVAMGPYKSVRVIEQGPRRSRYEPGWPVSVNWGRF